MEENCKLLKDYTVKSDNIGSIGLVMSEPLSPPPNNMMDVLIEKSRLKI